ncbi:PLP-dependent aminotransferase family protein [Pararhodobacter zhoushanensis]|uniref:MocR-like pyridoxine biosynthesis transcription factor PdxR n=1 Tax=Pararhodobacter zhoushanensis TaxID=2479545 RepID=UPI000F8D55DF|nr:PLP-dependent aminotransferase family protein [Pararhodobacter zhoushanensis]
MTISVECFLLDPQHSGTLQSRIRQMVAEGILAGRLRPGERMPSSRRLAEHLSVSRITVTLAYADLVADDYLRARGRSGYFVSDSAPQPGDFPQPGARGTDAVDWARALGHRPASGQLNMGKPRNWREFRYPFVYGQADPELFDHANWRGCMIQALGQRDFARMTDDQFEQDDPGLLEYIARHTLPRRGILARGDEILVTLGAQNALWLTAQLLLNQRRNAGIEEPGYPGLRDILNQTRCKVTGIPVGPRGLEPDALPEGMDVLFCTPSHHCPTGATMPLEARHALLEVANARGLLVIEDDYEFEISHDRAPLPALKSLDREGRVIHIGSFSKSMFPGLRLGFLVGPAEFIREARALRATVLRHPPGLLQRAAAHFLSLGHYDAMLRRLTRAFAARRAVMLEAVRAEGLTIAGAAGDGGSSLWMRTPDGVSATELSQALRADSVLIEPGGPFFGESLGNDRCYRIAYSSITQDRIAEGIARIARRTRAMTPQGQRKSRAG